MVNALVGEVVSDDAYPRGCRVVHRMLTIAHRFAPFLPPASHPYAGGAEFLKAPAEAAGQ